MAARNIPTTKVATVTEALDSFSRDLKVVLYSLNMVEATIAGLSTRLKLAASVRRISTQRRQVPASKGLTWRRGGWDALVK